MGFKSIKLPMDPTLFYNNYVLKGLQEKTPFDIKNTSYKKAIKFLQ